MSRYHYRLINELRMQLCYSPERRRREQLERLEKLISEIRPGRTYRYDALAESITNYRPSRCPSDKLLGDHLRYDLTMLVEDLSYLLDIEAADQPDEIYSVNQLMDMFDVSPRAIFEWRVSGLPVRYYVMPDGEKRMGISKTAMGEFMAATVANAVRAPKFAKVSERQIVQECARALAKEPLGLTELAEMLEQRFGLAPLAAKYIIVQHDRLDHEKALYRDTFEPLAESAKQGIFAANREGASIQRLMTKYNRSRHDLYRVVRQVKAERIIGDGIESLYNEEFDAPDADQVILKMDPSEGNLQHVGRRETHVPAYLTDLCKVPLLGKEEEPDLFRRYNYLKYKLSSLWESTCPSRLSAAALEEMRWLRNESTELRNRLLEANLRLVIRMAYKHVGPMANVNELISDGNVSLMQAVEKFDYSKGFRFSTYASWAILKNFAKSIPEDSHRSEKFVTGQSELLNSVPDSSDRVAREEASTSMRSAINRVLSKLSVRERKIVSSRFGIGIEDHAQTLGEVGKDLNVTRERVRQIEARAIQKMRKFLKKECIEIDV